MKKIILTLLLLVQVNESVAQNTSKTEYFLEMITKYENFAAKSVDDYTISLYQNNGRSEESDLIVTKLNEDRHFLDEQKLGFFNDTTYTVGVVDFLDTVILYFESSSNSTDLSKLSHTELEDYLSNLATTARSIDEKYMALMKQKELFFAKHNLPIKMEYEGTTYRNQFFRFTSNFMEIITKIDYADFKLQESLLQKNKDSIAVHASRLQDYIASSKEKLEKLGSYKNEERMFYEVSNYVSKFQKFHNNTKNIINLLTRYDDLKSSSSTSEGYAKKERLFNSDKQFALENAKMMQIEKNNLVVSFDNELNNYKDTEIEIIIYFTPYVKNQLVSMRKN